jgi:coenzyme F420-dependent glucose-6-phosphate dehydrogenase
LVRKVLARYAEADMLQLGWKAGTEQYGPSELLDYALAAEEAGFDSVAASDHFHPWSEKGQASFVWTWLGAVAARTKSIVLGTSVTCPILRYHPSIIAQAAATVACMAPKRFFLGVGTGEALNEYAAVGQYPGYNIRREQLLEAIELIRALFSGERVTHRGIWYETRKAKLYTRPSAPVPIYISSLVPNSATFVGKYGDGLITVGGEEPESYKEMFRNFAAGAKESRKDGKRMPKVIEIAVDFTGDEEKAIELRKQYWAGAMVPAMFTEKLYTPEMSEQNGKVVGSDTIRQSTCISDDPDVHVKHAQRYIDLGFDHLVFHSAGPDQRAFIEAYGRHVLPRLRQKAKSRQKVAA